MQITTYQTNTNWIRTSSLKKLSNRTWIELIKKFNWTNRTQTKIESNTELIINFSYGPNQDNSKFSAMKIARELGLSKIVYNTVVKELWDLRASPM
jgi:hypothetical protein